MTHLSESTFKIVAPFYNKRGLTQLEDKIIQFIRLAKPINCKYHLIQSTDKSKLIPFIFVQLKVKNTKKSVNAYRALTDIVSHHITNFPDQKQPSITSAIKHITSDLGKVAEIKDFLSKLERFVTDWIETHNFLNEIKIKQLAFLDKRKAKEKNELRSLLCNLKQLDWTLSEVIDTWNELLVQEVMDS